MQRAEALFDSLTLAAVAREIRALGRARFAGVRQPAPDTVVVSLRAGIVHHLLVSIHPRTARVHFAARPQTAERLGQFGMLLRSRLTEARLDAVEQPPFNRLLRLGFDALEGRLWLIAELMGRHSNLILADERVVLGALKVVTAQMSARRPVLPGRAYVPPPADRPTPETLDAEGLRNILRSPLPLERRLSQALLGVSPLLAQEIAMRAGVDPATPAADAVESAGRIGEGLRAITTMVADGAFSPTLYVDGSRVVAFAAFPMRVHEGSIAQPSPTMSEAIDRYFDQEPATALLAERRSTLAGTVKAALARREAALEASHRTLEESRAGDRYRVMGDLILTHARQVKPRDQHLRVPDYTSGGDDVTIPLDPALTPSENAQQYFRRYAKARATGRALPARIAQLEAETRALRDALVQIDGAASSDDLWEIQSDLAAAGLAGRAPRGRPAARAGPRRFRAADGAVILVGRSARENDRITFHEAGPEDIWLHARGVAGAHVILKSDGRPSEADIQAAAQTAAYYSAGRESGQVAVDAIERKHVRKLRGAPPGAVTYMGERTLLVSPALPPAIPTGERMRSGR
ncbi:MAG TPA: NFACT RNA binding domain-containing protein [bacterium]|nr:NFACT RNA binding domain-containing protein [bacterium]